MFSANVLYEIHCTVQCGDMVGVMQRRPGLDAMAGSSDNNVNLSCLILYIHVKSCVWCLVVLKAGAVMSSVSACDLSSYDNRNTMYCITVGHANEVFSALLRSLISWWLCVCYWWNLIKMNHCHAAVFGKLKGTFEVMTKLPKKLWKVKRCMCVWLRCLAVFQIH